ncbi:MAG: UDP-N-acetylglucosamine--N-acetylmuramyl-(pentapeptide) pyrophosphoryl-undecaprenol N-acetylglucosamine transferase [Gemmatimonadetes bacterium]|nr:UDP-N-acetylglucosamine--N-acetylmuramyl-(pentapeptide) pyrophosphoryl-undecaprenol N-acetylglucosamine transferase [Gemmatimonadota bacterium]
MRDARCTRVFFAGGGTGGHLYPALALADALVALRPDVRPFFVGASRGVESSILPRRGVEHALLPVEGFARGGGLAGVRALPRLAVSLLQVAALFQAFRPEAVVVTGGYAGGPAGIAAGATGTPLVLQEQNAVPGVTTRLLSLWASQVHVAFPEAVPCLPRRARGHAVLSGNPVRPAPLADRTEARTSLGLPADGRVLLVVGGSQGAAALNRTLAEAVQAVERGELPPVEGLSVLWSTGPRHYADALAALAAAGNPAWVRAVPYIDEMPSALVAADIAVSRAGAMATAELLNHGLPAVLVPLPPAAADHQTRNAKALVAAGAAVLATEDGLSEKGLWGHVTRLALDADLRRSMAAAARARAHPHAAREIAGHIATLLPRRAA